MSSQILGFDFGEKAVKAVLLADGKIRRAVSMELPENSVSGGVILSMENMADFLKAKMKENHLHGKKVSVLLPPSLVYTYTAAVPAMSERQMEYDLPFQFGSRLKEEKDRYFYDYEVREVLTDGSGEPREMRVFSCAALKKTIEDYRNMFSGAGLTLVGAVPEEYAYARLIGKCASLQDFHGTVCLVDIGHHGTRVHTLRGGENDSSRDIEQGASEICHISDDKNSGSCQTSENESAEDACESLTGEIAKALNFYNYNNRNAELQDLYLTGGGAAVGPLVHRIADVTHLRVHPAEELIGEVEGGAARYVRAAACAMCV